MSRLRSAPALVLALVLAAFVAAGCGGDSEEKNDYVDQVNELQLAYVDDVTALVSAAPPTTPQESAEVATELADLTEGVADDIEAVDPPEEVADLHDELVATLRDVVDQIRGAQKELASDDPQAAANAASELQAATSGAQTELNSLIDQINTTLQE